MEQVQEIAQQSQGNWFSYLMGMIIIYHLYERIKNKDLINKMKASFEKLEDKIKEKLD
jgi:hypothetical protein